MMMDPGMETTQSRKVKSHKDARLIIQGMWFCQVMVGLLIGQGSFARISDLTAEHVETA
jgi:hypothetical protein